MQFTQRQQSKSQFGEIAVFVVFLVFTLAGPVRAQDHTVAFSTIDPGVTRSITNWGLDTCWSDPNNMIRGQAFMGSNNVSIVRVGFVVDAPLTNNELSDSQKAELQVFANIAVLAGPNTRWDMNWASALDPWYESQTNPIVIRSDRWAAAIMAAQRYYNRNLWAVEGFNEPDFVFPYRQQDLYNIFGYLQASTNFPGTLMEGGSTLNTDGALSWFNVVSPRATIGSTHCLAGSVANYATFCQSVTASNAMPFAPEMHNVGEAMMGVNYGLQGGIWWGTAERARGEFVKACQGGKQLAYADDWANWNVAAVYRGTNGVVQAFVGENERMAIATTYQLFSKDRDVFYDGDGPRRDYLLTTTGAAGYGNPADRGAERVVNITWGADVQPLINGRYLLVNRNSLKVMEVPGGSTNSGTLMDQNTYTNGLNQQWDVMPVVYTNGGDYSYFSMTAAHSGKAADVFNFSQADGGSIDQWDDLLGVNQQWYLEYVTNGWFYIRSKWSAKCLEVASASTANGASIQQRTPGPAGLSNQQWRLIPVGASPTDLTAPAAPTGVSALANAVSVQLNWAANTEPDLAGYTVLRSPTNAGPYFIVARGMTNNAFTDKSANLPQPYYYVVQAVDRSLNTSVNSAQVSATPTAGPALVAHYVFDGNTSDSSGNANHAIINYSSPTFVAGKYGSAMDLNGTNQYTMLPANMLAGVTNFTMATWVNWDGGNAWQRIFDFGNDTTSYMLLTPSSGSALRFAITTNGGWFEQSLQTTAPLVSNQWIHIAVTRNGNITRLYTNGVVAVAATNVVTIAPASFNPALNYLGKSQYAADPLFNGRLDEFSIYNYALSGSEIAGLVNLSAPLPTLVHRYSFGETSGTVVNDSIGGPTWNGTLPNGGTFGGGQLTLNPASSQYVNLPAGILSNYTAVTIEAWASFPNQIAWNTMLFDFGNTVSGVGNSYIFCAPQGGRIAITSTNFTGEQNAYGGIDFSFHTNLHITAIYNPPANYLGIYTNGVLAGVNTVVTTPLSAVNNVFSYIGQSLYGGDAFFNFSIDEFRIYNGAMQAADIAAAQFVGPNVLLTTNVTLNMSSNGGGLTMSWPVAGSGFTLVSSPTLGNGAVWTPVLVTPGVVGVNNQLTIAPANGTLFFRLQR